MEERKHVFDPHHMDFSVSGLLPQIWGNLGKFSTSNPPPTVEMDGEQRRTNSIASSDRFLRVLARRNVFPAIGRSRVDS